jgi:hypothetical protein
MGGGDQDMGATRPSLVFQIISFGIAVFLINSVAQISCSSDSGINNTNFKYKAANRFIYFGFLDTDRTDGKVKNPRFVVTLFSSEEFGAHPLYEEQYCGRGDMENRIKEQQLCLFADRSSCATMRANQCTACRWDGWRRLTPLRLWFSSVAYTLMLALRRLGLKGTKLAKAQCGNIRLKLLKIGAQVRVTVRKIWVWWSESYPYQQLFRQVYENLVRLLRPGSGQVCPITLRC